MEAEAGQFLFLGFFQLALLAALFGGRARAGRYLPLVLLLNGAYALVSALKAEGLGELEPALRLLDIPTGLLILAFALQRYARRERWASAAALVGLGEGIAFALIPGLGEGLPNLFLATVPLYAGYGAVLLGAARTGTAGDAWVALAFLPRAVEFASASTRGLLSPDPAIGLAAPIVGVALMIAATVATSWLVHRAPPAQRASASALFLTGLLLMVTGTLEARPPTAADLLTSLSLGLLRPALLTLAFFPGRTLAHMLGVGALVFAVAVGGDLAARRVMGLAGPVAPVLLGTALALPLLGLAALATKRLDQRFEEGAPAPGARATAEPQWQRLVLALRKSSDGTAASLSWTQKELARVTGIPVQRVSEFSDVLNRRAARRLDDLVPRWRERFGPGVPALVVKHRGLVPGAPGVQVYYRLTPAGEAVAEALSSRSAGIPAESGA